MSSSARYHRDYETRSAIDLKKTGVFAYAAHPTTDIWCMSCALDDEDVATWEPGEPIPGATLEAGLSGDVQAWAHNNQFEAVIEKYIAGPRYGLPVFAQEQQRCTMVGAYASGLPGSLAGLAPAIALDTQKDMLGHRLMMQMARPRKVEFAKGFSDIPHSAVRVAEMDPDGWEVYEDGRGRLVAKVQWWNQPDKRARLRAYCREDTVVERGAEKKLRPLSDSELRLWHLDQVINSRGVLVDEALANSAKTIVKKAQGNLDERMRTLTNQSVSRCSNRNQLVTWVRENGVECESINKAALETLLEDDNPIPAHVRDVLLVRQESAKASVAKIDALLNGKSPEDDRAKGLLQFHAADTGRWGGRRFQPQNLKRPEELDIDTVIDIVASGDFDYLAMMYDKPLSAVSDILRGLLIAAPGHRIVAADYSNIEGRVLAWLAGEQWKIEAFRDFDAGVGHDLYKITAGGILHKAPGDVTKDERQSHGKVPELALGYQGGVGAFSTMAANYNVDLTVPEIEAIRDGWREKHPAIKGFWHEIEDAAVEAVRYPGRVTRVKSVAFKVAGSFLMMRLPSGRFLAYAFPQIREFEVPWGGTKEGLTYFSTIDVSKKSKVVPDERNSPTWSRIKTYGGMLTNNAVQGTARDVLADAMPRLEAAGYPIILSVHDEVVCEVPYGHGSVEEMEDIMSELPTWAKGLPVAAEGFEGERYKK